MLTVGGDSFDFGRTAGNPLGKSEAVGVVDGDVIGGIDVPNSRARGIRGDSACVSQRVSGDTQVCSSGVVLMNLRCGVVHDVEFREWNVAEDDSAARCHSKFSAAGIAQSNKKSFVVFLQCVRVYLYGHIPRTPRPHFQGQESPLASHLE